MKKEATNKQIMAAYEQSYKLMQEAKRYDDKQKKNKKTSSTQVIHIKRI